MPERELRLVLVGLGAMAQTYCRLLARVPRTRLVGLVHPRRAAVPPGMPALAVYPTIERAAARTGADGCIIASPNRAHADQVAQCLSLGLPALVEKPVAATVADIREVVRRFGSAPDSVLVGHHRLHNPVVTAARRAVAGGALGRLVSVQGAFLVFKPDSYFSAAPWRAGQGGGPILINLVHDISVLRHLCGEVQAVTAFTARRGRRAPAEDTAAVAMAFAEGALGTFALSDVAVSAQSWEQTAGENPAFPVWDGGLCYRLSGTRGELDLPSLRLRAFAHDGFRSWLRKPAETQVSAGSADPLAAQLHHFCDVIDGRARPAVTLADGIRILAVAEAILRASASGRAERPEAIAAEAVAIDS